MRTVDIRPPRDVAEVQAGARLFDDPPEPAATARFLASPIHHLLFAYLGSDHTERDDDPPVGFVSGVEETHPDKGTEMFLYELAVDESARNRGIGRALVRALADIARERGCYGMYVLTDRDNEAALHAYTAAAGKIAGDHVMLEWHFEDSGSPE
jgi:ribosomal protein S18 acetylase RimI-like enzyme